MKARPILIDDTKKELTHHGTREFPLSMDLQQVRAPGHGGVDHWHREIQILLVTKGAVRVRAGEGGWVLSEGQGAFINSGVLHQADPVEEMPGVYVCVNFAPELLCGPVADGIRSEYVEPLLESRDLACIPLRDSPWEQEICQAVREIWVLYEDADFGYELEIKSILLHVWRLLAVNLQGGISGAADIPFVDRQRAREMKNFIERNYSQHLDLADIAEVCHISRGECCRVFKRVSDLTPVQYLINIRLERSLALLTGSSLSVAEVGVRVGFGTTSHFIAVFRRKMGMTPRTYREKHRKTEEC